MATITEVAKQFTDYYYNTFDTNKGSLQPVYREHSIMTWEGQEFRGTDKIFEKLSSLPFQRVQHKITTLDAQPSNPSINSLLVLVTGLLLVDDESNPMQFTQTFQLIPDGESYWVYNDVFRLNYG